MSKNKTIADIEVLRAVAILMVLVHHSEALLPHIAPTTLQAGLWAGVDLFFCISGFVIARSLLGKWPADQSGERFLRFCIPFWVARFWRIMPAACFWLGVMVLNAWYLSPDRLTASILDAIATLLQVANLHFYHCAVNQAGFCGNGSIYWSLSLEFQFYLALPVLLFFCPRRWIVPALLAALVVQLFIPHQHWNTLLSFIRTDAFILGVLIAWFRQSPLSGMVSPRFLSHPLLCVGAGIVLTGLLAVSGNQVAQIIPNPMALTTLLCGVWVWIASHDAAYVLPQCWLKRLLVWVGGRSYGIYLLHPPVLGWMWRGWESAGMSADSTAEIIALIAIASLVVAIVAELNYRLIEQRFRKRR